MAVTVHHDKNGPSGVCTTQTIGNNWITPSIIVSRIQLRRSGSFVILLTSRHWHFNSTASNRTIFCLACLELLTWRYVNRTDGSQSHTSLLLANQWSILFSFHISFLMNLKMDTYFFKLLKVSKTPGLIPKLKYHVHLCFYLKQISVLSFNMWAAGHKFATFRGKILNLVFVLLGLEVFIHDHWPFCIIIILLPFLSDNDI